MQPSPTIVAPRTTPPFRADIVGSFLRPAELRAARARHEAGLLDAATLRGLEDRLILDLIGKQRAAGLRVVTDGEFRRGYWHYDFLTGLDGIELYRPPQGLAFHGATLPTALRITGKVRWNRPVFIDDFRFVAGHAAPAMAKQTIPAPSVAHFRGGRAAIDAQAYPDMAEFYADLGTAYHHAVQEFAAAGCRYLQMDEVFIAYLCDPAQRDMLRARGEDPDAVLAIYGDMINRGIAGRPPGMMAAMHLCRGNFRSSFVASGGYDRVADLLFNRLDMDAYFMEYDSERAGGFAPLRLLPRGRKMVVLGLVTSKTGELESRDSVLRRIEQAAKFAPIEQLALSPQCGFASTEEGNDLTEAQQWAKIRLCVDIANEVWGAG